MLKETVYSLHMSAAGQSEQPDSSQVQYNQTGATVLQRISVV